MSKPHRTSAPNMPPTGRFAGNQDSARPNRSWLPFALVGLGLIVAMGFGIIAALALSKGAEPISTATDPVNLSSNHAPELRTSSSTTLDPTTPTTATSTTRPPTTTAAPTTTLPPLPAFRSGVVSRTCGRSGNGDCFLSVRSAPNSDGPEVYRLDEGSAIDVTCQTYGERVTSSVLGYPTTIWLQMTSGNYVTAAFVDAPGWDPKTLTSPC